MTTDSVVDIGELFQTYHRRILGYIYSRVNDDNVAAELASDVFLRAVDAEQRGMGAVVNSRNWLFATARNAVTDFYRWRQRAPFSAELDAMDEDNLRPYEETWLMDGLCLEEQVEQNERYALLHLAISRLADEQATVILQRMDGYEFEEIAEGMEKSVGAVKALQHRGYVALHKQLSPYIEVQGDRTPTRMNRVDEVKALLIERGPLTTSEIRRALRITRGQAASALAHDEIFVCIGKRMSIRSALTFLWGVRGVHDQATQPEGSLS